MTSIAGTGKDTGTPEGTDEAKVAFRSLFFVPINTEAERAFDAGMAAALAAAAPYIAAKALRDIAAEDGGSLLATAWVLRRADDIERAARAAGKDKT